MNQDFYPSRQDDSAAILDRVDPVVYAGGCGPLSAEDVAFFDKNGFLFLPAFFDARETKIYQDEMQQIRQSLDGADRDDVIVEPGSREMRSVFEIHRNGDKLKSLSQDRRIVDRIRQLLASDVYIHQSRVNYKPGFKGKEFNWHSDFETWHVEDGVPRMRMTLVLGGVDRKQRVQRPADGLARVAAPLHLVRRRHPGKPFPSIPGRPGTGGARSGFSALAGGPLWADPGQGTGGFGVVVRLQCHAWVERQHLAVSAFQRFLRLQQRREPAGGPVQRLAAASALSGQSRLHPRRGLGFSGPRQRTR